MSRQEVIAYVAIVFFLATYVIGMGILVYYGF